MKKTILILALLPLTLIAGCVRDSIEVTQKGDFNVELLFEQDGCKVYRFLDGGRFVYWSDCRGKIQQDYTTKSGKTNVEHHQETINTGQ